MSYFLNKKKNYVSYKILENTKENKLALKDITISLLKGFKRYFYDGLCGLMLEVGHLNDL